MTAPAAEAIDMALFEARRAELLEERTTLKTRLEALHHRADRAELGADGFFVTSPPPPSPALQSEIAATERELARCERLLGESTAVRRRIAAQGAHRSIVAAIAAAPAIHEDYEATIDTLLVQLSELHGTLDHLADLRRLHHATEQRGAFNVLELTGGAGMPPLPMPGRMSELERFFKLCYEMVRVMRPADADRALGELTYVRQDWDATARARRGLADRLRAVRSNVDAALARAMGGAQ